MSNESTGLDAKGSARRKLIRGSFAVPAVLTLHNGGAMAAASVNTSLKRQNRHPRTETVSYSKNDVWFRYQLWGQVKDGKVVGDEGWIKGSDLNVYKVRGNSVWLESGRVQRYNLNTNQLDWEQKYEGQMRGPNELKRINRWVSLRVDGDGNLRGAGKSGMGSAVADSCWNSFAAGMQL